MNMYYPGSYFVSNLLRKLSLLFILALTAVAVEAQAPGIIPDRMITNGQVMDLKPVGNAIYVAGDFKFVGYKASNGHKLDADGNLKSRNELQINGEVYCSVPDGEGGWIIGGVFTRVLGQTRNNLARINADGTLHSWNPNPNFGVRCLVWQGTTLYLGGQFTSIMGTARGLMAAIDMATGTLLPWNPGLNNAPRSMIIDGARMYIGGYFTSVGGTARNYLACIDLATGALLPTALPDASRQVDCMVLHGNTLFVGGYFTMLGRVGRTSLGAIDVTTGTVTSWVSGLNEITAWVYGLAVADGKLFVGGEFTRFGAVNRKNIASFDLSTMTLTSWNPSADKVVSFLGVNGTRLYAGGSFTRFTNPAADRRGAAAFDLTTGDLLNFNPASDNGKVNTIVQSGTETFVGGSFFLLNSFPRNNVAAFNAVTGELLPWDPNTNGSVGGLKAVGNTMYLLKGQFSTINGNITRSYTAAVDINSGIANSFNPIPNGSVNGLEVIGSVAYIGGAFTMINNRTVTRNRIAAVDAVTGAAVTSWNPDMNSTVNCIEKYGNNIIAAGHFTTVGGTARTYLAMLDATTGALQPMPVIDGYISDLAWKGTELWIAGSFINLGGKRRNNVGAINMLTGTVNDFSASFDQRVVYKILPTDRGIYVSGDFNRVNNVNRGRMAVLEYSGVLNPWNIGSIDNVYTMALINNHLYIGGSFTGVDRSNNKPYLAALQHNIILPLTWKRFNVVIKNNHSILQWVTDQEINTKEFIVQHSTDGNNWKQAGSVQAAGNSTTPRFYEFIHPNPVLGINHYRLLQVDLDAKSSFSKIVSVRLADRQTAFMLLENPVSNQTLQLQSSQPMLIQLFGADGKPVLQKNISAGTHQINTGQLPQGVYLLKAAEHTQKIVIR